MDKQYYYYQCDVNSSVGKKLQKFWDAWHRAAWRADDYARKYGACSYVQPVQYFEGGVDYLEFDHEPDLKVWRLRVKSKDGHDEYEPNCMVKADILVVMDARFQPSDTWDKTFAREHVTWEVAKPKKTLEQWAKIVGLNLTDDKQKDEEKLDAMMANRSFVPFLEYYGEHQDKSKSKAPQWLRKAIKAEKDRQALPVVEVEWLYALLDMQRPEDKEELKKWMANMETPLFFVYGESFYVRSQCVCKAEGLHPITEGSFTYKKNVANREAKLDN